MNAGVTVHCQTTMRPRWRFPRLVWRGERWMLIDSVSGLLPALRLIAFCFGTVSNFQPKPNIYPRNSRYLCWHKTPMCLYSVPVVFLANYSSPNWIWAYINEIDAQIIKGSGSPLVLKSPILSHIKTDWRTRGKSKIQRMLLGHMWFTC